MCLLLSATCSIAILSYLNDRPGTSADLSAAAGVVSGFSAALTAWQEYNGVDRKINRYTNAILSIKNHILWWDSLPPVDQNSLPNINRLVGVGEDVKTGEVNSWADASRHTEDNGNAGEGEGENQQTSATFEVENPVFEG